MTMNPNIILVVTTIHCEEPPAVKTVTTVGEFMELFGDEMRFIAEENHFEIENGWYTSSLWAKTVWCNTRHRDMIIVRCDTLNDVITELAREIDRDEFDYIEHDSDEPIPMVYDGF